MYIKKIHLLKLRGKDMNSFISVFLVIFLITVYSAQALSPPGKRHRQNYFNTISNNNNNNNDNIIEEEEKKYLNITTTKKLYLEHGTFFKQDLDHFDRTNKQTFLQRYFVNESVFNPQGKSGAVVFLCVGGEGPPLDGTVLSTSVHCTDMVELAKQHNALMVALEHRYYGASKPFVDLTTNNLKWLSSQQALGDIATFHAMITEKYSLISEKTKWITFGGSYPGMMASFARIKYPNLIHGAISSSSPVRAQLDFPEYNEVVAKSMSNPIVGGSEKCLTTIIDGHARIGELLNSKEGQAKLSKDFNLCDQNALSNKDNQRVFAGDGVVTLPVQANDPSCQSDVCNIEKTCEVLTSNNNSSSSSSSYDNLVKLSLIQQNGQCLNVNYSQEVEFMKRSTADRSWIYQTCTEYGFYATCGKDTSCPYTKGLHTLQNDLDLCKELFGILPEQVEAGVRYTNLEFGSNMPKASRILYPNGDIDPWHALGVLQFQSYSLPTLYVNGASHHFWTHKSLSTDQPQVKAAREIIWYQVSQWLNSEPRII